MTDYRNYEINREHSTGRYIARPCDDDDFEMASFDLSRLTRAIDQLWEALSHFKDQRLKSSDIEVLPISGWVRNWLRSNTSHVDIDHAFATGNL